MTTEEKKNNRTIGNEFLRTQKAAAAAAAAAGSQQYTTVRRYVRVSRPEESRSSPLAAIAPTFIHIHTMSSHFVLAFSLSHTFLLVGVLFVRACV